MILMVFQAFSFVQNRLALGVQNMDLRKAAPQESLIPNPKARLAS
jgi:hypothetical protein